MTKRQQLLDIVAKIRDEASSMAMYALQHQQQAAYFEALAAEDEKVVDLALEQLYKFCPQYHPSN